MVDIPRRTERAFCSNGALLAAPPFGCLRQAICAPFRLSPFRPRAISLILLIRRLAYAALSASGPTVPLLAFSSRDPRSF